MSLALRQGGRKARHQGDGRNSTDFHDPRSRTADVLRYRIPWPPTGRACDEGGASIVCRT
jgi:hypothetical protein